MRLVLSVIRGILFASTLTSIACGGEAFELPPPAPAETSGETLGDDTGSTESSGDDTGSNETCVANGCGGCGSLTGAIGDTCGACGDGKLACKGGDELACEGARDPNACGGCGPLPAESGTSCGSCGGGKWTCDGPDSLKCVGADDLNKCGGCSVLANDKDAPCGSCSGGQFVCDGLNATKCSDPVTTPPGATCGTCGTQKTVCASDGKSTVCPKTDDRNKCGGCGTLAGDPGTACGTCGVWSCSTDKTKVDCKEAAPAVNTSCGTCMKSKYVCSSVGATSCSALDDRKLMPWGTTDTTVGAIETTNGARALGVEMSRGKSGPITSVKVNIARTPYICPPTSSPTHPDPNCDTCSMTVFGDYHCKPKTETAGALKLKVFVGPYLGGVMSIYEATMPAGDAALATAGWVEFKMPAGLQPSATDRVYVDLSSDSTLYHFQWNRTPYSSTNPYRACTRAPERFTFTCDNNQSRPVQLISNTCDY